MAEELKALAERAKELHPDTKPKWGIMTAQLMLEHVADLFAIANGKIDVPAAVDEAYALESKKQLLEEMDIFPVGIVNPLTRAETRLPNLAAAIARLDKNVAEFYAFHSANPGAKPMHPMMGRLSFAEWEKFETMHMIHHWKQFGLLV